MLARVTPWIYQALWGAGILDDRFNFILKYAAFLKPLLLYTSVTDEHCVPIMGKALYAVLLIILKVEARSTIDSR